VRVPRESREFIALDVRNTETGTPVTSGIEYALIQAGRPTTWQPAAIRDGVPGLITGDLAPGRYYVWVRITTATETPVDTAGWLDIT
jgi:hypothetical protein